ncbi:MATE family efflux transporter [Eremococcus coleocola]|uniref:MATE family efflux transporter n=1 Tax=Eremococcus coleocola TaxID=88132 RepID=UPI00040F1291|nr:MATE family efflux transporter [Eremococcus coleocola]
MELTNNKQSYITTGPINQIIMTISVPLMINNLVRTLYNLTDGLFVAQISAEDFAATAFVWPLNFLFIAIGMGIGVGATAIIAQFLGAKRKNYAQHYANNTLVLTFLVGLAACLIGIISAPTMLRWMQATGTLFDKSLAYLRINYIGLFFDFLYFGYQAILNAQGKTKTITTISFISSLTNVLLDPFFIFERLPLLGLPGLNMGIQGAAWATVISKILLYVLAFRISQKESEFPVSMRQNRFDLQVVQHITKVATPTAVGYGGSALGFTVLNGLIAGYGTDTLAAYSMVNRITDIITQPQMGIGGALTSIIGQNMGAQAYDRVRAFFKRAVAIVLSISFVASLLVLLFQEPLLSIFIKQDASVELWMQAKEYLAYTAFIIFFMGLFSIFNGYFQGCGKTKYGMFMEIGRLWLLRLPVIWVLGEMTSLGSTGIWIAMLVSNAGVCLFGYYIYKTRDWTQTTV